VTGARELFWSRLRNAVPDLPAEFAPGVVRCPCHEDSKPSFWVGYEGGQVRFKCHAGCEKDAIRKRLGLGWADLFDDSPHGEVVATYVYTDERGMPLFRKLRREGKKFQFQYQDPTTGAWVYGRGKAPHTLYRLPRVRQAIAAGELLWVVEGEKDVETLEINGEYATCNPRGAAEWRPEYTEQLGGAKVRIVCDNDEAGIAHGGVIYEALQGVAAERELVRGMVNRKGADATDHFNEGGSTDDFIPLSPLDSPATLPPPPAEPPKLAFEQRILDRFLVAVRGCGVVGEDATAATTYLVLTSRLLDKQASLAVKGHSASGKSYTVEQTVRFFPAEAVIVMTGMSEHALIYSPEEYSHRTLVLYEATALREGQEDNQTAYFVRSLLSEGRLEYPVTVKDKDGNFTTKTIVKEGPVNLIVTTTKVQVHSENETRMLSVTTDDSREQTARVFAALADETDSDVDLDEWVQLQRWLAAHGERRVTIPYARQLAELVPPVAVRLRRDFGTLLALVRAHAVLHQQSRQRNAAGKIVATTDDYEQVRALVEGVIASGVGQTVSPTVRSTVEAVAALTEPVEPLEGEDPKDPPCPDGATARKVADLLELDKSAARRRLQAAGVAGYVFNAEDQRGKPGRWRLGEPLPDGARLLPVESALATPPEPEPAGQDDGGLFGGRVASESQVQDEDPGRWSR
jgi:hypothetical protein